MNDAIPLFKSHNPTYYYDAEFHEVHVEFINRATVASHQDITFYVPLGLDDAIKYLTELREYRDSHRALREEG